MQSLTPSGRTMLSGARLLSSSHAALGMTKYVTIISDELMRHSQRFTYQRGVIEEDNIYGIMKWFGAPIQVRAFRQPYPL